MSIRKRKVNSWGWRKLWLRSQPNLVRQHVLSLPTQFQTIASTEGSVSPRDERWKTMKPVVSINKVHDNVIDGWVAAVGSMNVWVEGYVSQ
ncbi:hypothetical protein MLDJOKPK_00148 [Salmonella phage SPAsTU]|nr:hypothetical protein STsAS_003 [Salmonella phage STsAS]AXF51102.1 hypothetical protein MLDJOKPK_00148 [Salmonella phage SPAsTU]